MNAWATGARRNKELQGTWKECRWRRWPLPLLPQKPPRNPRRYSTVRVFPAFLLFSVFRLCGPRLHHRTSPMREAELVTESMDLESRFTECCKVKLSLDEKYMQHALQLFQETKSLMADTSSIGAGTVEEIERIWTAGILYVVKKMDQIDSPGFTLTQILRVTNISVVEFFKEIPQFLGKCSSVFQTIYPDEWERKLQVKEDQANFVHLMVLFNYYKRIYPDYFLPEIEASDANGDEIPIQMRFGWLLFLAVRVHVLGQFPDLVTCTNALLAVIAIMIVHMPISSRKFSSEDKALFSRQGSGGVNIIASLCNIGDASEEDVAKMVEKTQSMISNIFTNLSGTSADNHVESLSGFSTEGLMYFEGLMDDKLLASNLRILEGDYEEAHNRRGNLDERFCMNGEEGFEILAGAGASLQGDKNFSSSQGISVTGSQAIFSPSGSPCSSPAKTAANSRMPPPTPVSVTMTTAKWLRTVIAPLPGEPTSELQVYLKSCDRDITDEVKCRAKLLLEGIFPSHPLGSWKVSLQGSGSMDAMWAEQRRLEAIKLYYRVLCSMCRAESQRLHSKNLSALLVNERFHRCMVACSAELVLATHKTVIMTFPAVLEPTGITAFDLSKVIESFVRYEETLPRELKRHLNSIEERLLESMAWEKGSSMYNSLIVARPGLAQEITRLCLLADPMPSLDLLTPSHSRPLDQQTVKPESIPDGNPSSPEREVPSSMVTSELGDLVSPVKERPSAFSKFNSGKCNLSHLQSYASPQRANTHRGGEACGEKRNLSHLPSVFASPQRPNPHRRGETCAETVMNVFFQKVSKLAAIRIKTIGERLQQPNNVIEQIHSVVRYALDNITSIFFNRHLDQIILCSIYGVCKVTKLSITFKGIIYQYRKQPQCKNHVFRNVFLDLRRGGRPGHETGDIIKFYNDIFVPATKSFLVTLGPTPPPAAPGERTADDAEKISAPPGSPKASAFPSLPDMSPKKVSANQNVFVSPLRNTKVENIMSPHSRSLYACVGESTRAYQSPSKDLTAINNRLNNRRFGRLDFDEASLVSDSFVAGAFGPCIPNVNHHPSRLTSDSVVNQPSWTVPAPQSPPMKRPRLDR